MSQPRIYYQTDGITLWLGDCRDVLPMLAPGSAQAVVTDPPFGIGWDRATWLDDPAQYSEMMREWISRATVVVGDGPFFVWQALLLADRWHDWFPKGYRIFAACKGFVQFRPTPVQWSWDPIIFWGNLKGDPSVYRKDYFMQALAPFGANRPGIDHPCPKPLELVRFIVSLASLPRDTILDCFAGSGTTLLAAKQLGRRAIVVELEERYAEVTARRLSQMVLPLSADPEPREEQQKMLEV